MYTWFHLFVSDPRSKTPSTSGTIDEDISPPKLIKSVVASPTVMFPPITTFPEMSALPVNFKLEPEMLPVVTIFRAAAFRAVAVTVKLLVAAIVPPLL